MEPMEPEETKLEEGKKANLPLSNPPNSSTFQDPSNEMKDLGSQERFCTKCSFILLKCDLLGAYYCDSCRMFDCNQCHHQFSQKITCKCLRCTCCFLETCFSYSKIGKQCQNLCNKCFEENEPGTFNLSRYPCGHGICRLCLIEISVSNNFDPKNCYLCS